MHLAFVPRGDAVDLEILRGGVAIGQIDTLIPMA
jgi:hypothetical protein